MDTSTEHRDYNQRDLRLFYCSSGQEYQNPDKSLAPREETKIFSRNINNPDQNFFSRGSEIL